MASDDKQKNLQRTATQICFQSYHSSEEVERIKYAMGQLGCGGKFQQPRGHSGLITLYSPQKIFRILEELAKVLPPERACFQLIEYPDGLADPLVNIIWQDAWNYDAARAYQPKDLKLNLQEPDHAT